MGRRPGAVWRRRAASALDWWRYLWYLSPMHASPRRRPAARAPSPDASGSAPLADAQGDDTVFNGANTAIFPRRRPSRPIPRPAGPGAHRQHPADGGEIAAGLRAPGVEGFLHRLQVLLAGGRLGDDAGL